MAPSSNVRASTFLLSFLLGAASGCRERTRGVDVDPPLPVPDIVSAQGTPHAFRLSAQRGQVVVLTFGYTSCPDICPTTLSRLRSLSLALGPEAGRVETVFVTVDPPRDTHERLRSYVTAFDPRFHAVRLEGPTLNRVLTGFGVTATRNEVDGRRYENVRGRGTYSIDHTGGYFVLDTLGRLRFRLPHDATVEQLHQATASLLKAAPPPPAPVRVEEPRAQRSPSGVGAVYLRLVNPSRQEDTLRSARSEAAALVELHEVVAEGELLRMIPRPEGFVLPAGGELVLKPGGKHLMLYEVREGASIDLTLEFERSAPLHLSVPTLSLAGASP